MTIDLTVADITIRVSAAGPDMIFRVDEAAAPFLVKEMTPDVEIRAGWGNGSPWSGRDKIFDSGALWRMFRDGEHYIFHFNSPAVGPLPYKLSKFNEDFTAGEILFHAPYYKKEEPVNPLEYPLDELVISHFLTGVGGVEIHGCGLIDPDGRGYLFAGQSGAGKTTIAQLWKEKRGVRILSDDRIILRENEDGIWMHGTPWHGEGRMASPEKVPLSRVLLLRQGVDNTLIPQKKATAAARLFSCSFPPFHSPRALESALGFLDRVVTTVPCDEFIFTPDDRSVQYLENEKEKGR